MANNTYEPQRGAWWWSRLHFLVRLLGLLGVVAVCVGLVLVRHIDQFYGSKTVAFNTLKAGLLNELPAGLTDMDRYGVYALLCGAAALLVLFLVEGVLILRFVAARRSLMGFNALMQIALAAALLVGVNVCAFLRQPALPRFDCTLNKEFTLPANKEVENLERLQGETLIVVNVHPNEDRRGPRDHEAELIESAADHKVVELVKDLVDQFRQAGPRFRVVVLDAHDKSYQTQFEAVTKSAKPLRDAIEAAPESSIFFYSGGNVQQLSFREFYRLDLAASKASKNLVLLPQGEGTSGRGVETFARKIFNVDERRPRIGLLVVHGALTTDSNGEHYTHKGLRKALEARGFEVRDVVLWKDLLTRNPEAVAYTLDENRLVTLENKLPFLKANIDAYKNEQELIPKVLRDLKAPPSDNERRRLLQLSEQYFALLQGDVMLPEHKAAWIDIFERRLDSLPDEIKELEADLKKTTDEMTALHRQGVDLDRRISDVSGKMSRVLAECDLLFIPRQTRMNPGDLIPQRLHRLNEQHVAAIKEFLKAGKPVLAALGPANEPPSPGGPPEAGDKDDELNKLFAELGIRLGQQTVLFQPDSQAIVDYKEDSFLAPNTDDKVPPVDLDGAGTWVGFRSSQEPAVSEGPNPLLQSLRVTARSAGVFKLSPRFARPVYYDTAPAALPPAAEAASNVGLLAAPGNVGPLLAYTLPQKRVRRVVERTTDEAGAPTRAVEPAFLFASSAWNETMPFAQDEFGPKFMRPRPNDPANGTVDERRRGSFPIGIAVAAPLPKSWGAEAGKTARLVVIGKGDVFVGEELSVPQEQLLLQSTNWLLGREDLLPRDDNVWKYPRVEYSAAQKELFLWAGMLGLPASCAFLGILVLLARRVR